MVEMRQSFLVLLFGLCVVVSITSAGVFKIHSRITNPITSFFANAKTNYVNKTQSTNLGNVVDYVGYFSATDDYKPYYNTEAILSHTHAPSSSAYIAGSSIPIAPPKRGTYQYDTCGSNIVVPLTYNRKILTEQAIRPTYKSTDFPAGRTYPLVCNWNVQVSKNCSRARITMRVDGRSRLPDEEGCSKGYIRVSPFMKEAKICGRVNYIQPYYWYVEDQKPDIVTITMKNIGLNDGFSEGFSFTLSGECLPIEIGIKKFDVNKENAGSNSRWMYRLLSDSAVSGVPTVVIPGVVASTDNNPVPANIPQAANNGPKFPPVDTGNDAEMLMLIQKNKERNQTTTTTTTSTTTTTEPTTVTTTTPTTTTTKRPIPDFDLETPWDVLKPSKPTPRPPPSTPSTSINVSKPTVPTSLLSEPKPHPILSVKFPNRVQFTSTTIFPTSTKPTKKPVDTTFDLETPWQTLKNQSMPSTTIPPVPTSTTKAATPLAIVPTTESSITILKYNHRNQSISTYKPDPQPSTILPQGSTNVKLPVAVTHSSYPSRPSLSEIDSEKDTDDGESDALIVENEEVPDLPVDQVVDDALSYITTLLDNPLLQKSLPKKPLRKKDSPNLVVFKGFSNYPSIA
ncbi:mucin-2-like [Daphnia carinata]|uniref:mucin-2-like n=1 Tax=Daphnia carinata TaxID=120202 RepID=UPI00257E65B8|nr:mucin-2-like [Daphnia carinata]